MTEINHQFSYNGKDYIAFARISAGRIVTTRTYCEDLRGWYHGFEPYNHPNSIPARITEALAAGAEAVLAR